MVEFLSEYSYLSQIFFLLIYHLYIPVIDEGISGNISPTTVQQQPPSLSTTTSTAQRHHPNCTISAVHNQSNFHNQPPLLQPHQHHHHHNQTSSIDQDMMAIRDNDSLDLYFMSPDAYRAAEAIEFIAEHLRNEDQYIQVSFSTFVQSIFAHCDVTKLIKSMKKKSATKTKKPLNFILF